jgi:hypothetical protein
MGMLLLRLLLVNTSRLLLLLLAGPVPFLPHQRQHISRPAGHQCNCITWAQLC